MRFRRKEDLREVIIYGLEEEVVVDMNQEATFDKELNTYIYIAENGRPIYYDNERRSWMPIWYYSIKEV